MSIVRMFLNVSVLFCILTSARGSDKHQKLKYGAKQDGTISETYDRGQRITKRAISQQAAAKGFAALQKLLGNAKEVPTRSKNFRKYEKSGTADSAMQDFYDASPANVRESKTFDFSRNRAFGHNALIGQAGDRVLILKVNGDKFSKGRPVLEIRKTTRERYVRINYKKPNNDVDN